VIEGWFYDIFKPKGLNSVGFLFLQQCIIITIYNPQGWGLVDLALFYQRPGGVLKRVLYGEAPPRGPTPYPFIYHIFRKGTPFVYLLLEKGTPFIYLLKKI